MTKEEFAQLLSSKADYDEQLDSLSDKAKASGLIVVYNPFDEIVVAGVIDEIIRGDYDRDSYEDIAFMLHRSGAMHTWGTVLDDRYSMEEARAWQGLR